MSIEPPDPRVMPTMAYAARDSAATDQAHLTTLAVCHYVWAGLLALMSCFGLFYVAMGVAFASGAFPGSVAATRPNPGDERMLGLFFIIFGGVITLIGWSLAGCTIASGRFLSRRRRRMFSIVIAALNCACVPFGTVLGVFTLIVLSRDSVRQMYEDRPVAYPSSGNNTST